MTAPRRGSVLPTAALVGVTAAWGSTFFLIKDLLDEISVADFLAIRFAIAALALFLVFPRAVSRLSTAELRYGMFLGLVYGIAQLLQTVGLERTPASVAGFVTGMYVVATPLLAALVLKERIGRPVWVAVAAATAGLGVLSLHGLSISSGVAVIFVSALLYAVHIVGLGRWTTPDNVIGLAVVQMTTMCAVCTIAAVPDGISPPSSGGGWLALLYMALICGALSLLGQTWAQARLSSTRAAIVMTMEPVWAAFFAVLLGGENLSVRMLVGGGFVLTAMYLVELGPRRTDPADLVVTAAQR